MTPLSRLPTPLQPLPRLSTEVGVELWVKRDDLTGSWLSGNKIRKLDRLLGDALDQGADTVLTTGGIQSNHARATALACRQLGLSPHLLLRGSPPDVPDGNLLLDHLAGADLRWCDGPGYQQRDALLRAWADELRAQGRRPYVIPEGGSNGLGALAYRDAAKELAGAPPFDGIVVAVGSGGTVAGLALAGLPVHGIPVGDDAATFASRVHTIADDARRLDPSARLGTSWALHDGWQGPGYAQATPALWGVIRRVARTEGLLVDPVYTGKAMQALLHFCEYGFARGRWLFWHTGGTFGLFGRGAEVQS